MLIGDAFIEHGHVIVLIGEKAGNSATECSQV
jgi:hypothetical protein